MSALVDKGLKAKRESKYVDFKCSFNPEDAGEWCELLKDIVAMANSGGGVIVIGMENGGLPSGEDVTAVLGLDQATIVDKIRKYTGQSFAGVEVHQAAKEGQTVAALEISAVDIPMIFQNVGTYQVGPKKQKTAFSRGSLYFRHGAKSEPGTSEDLRMVLERKLDSIRREWLDGVRKVTTAPAGSKVTVFSGEIRESTSHDAAPIRLVDDPEAPGYRIIDQDETYPYRQTELINVINDMLPAGIEINSHDVLSVRRVHDIDSYPKFFHQPKYASPQYSHAFAQWVVDQHKADKGFFKKAREKHYAQNLSGG